MSEEPQNTSPVNHRETEAKARKAEAEATKAERELPGAAELAAKARKAIAEAERDTAAARKDQLAALIPDFGSVTKSTLEEKSGEVFLAPFLIFGALGHVAQTISTRVFAALRGTASPRVLVTTNPDLTSGDALYWEVKGGLERMQNSAAALLKSLEPPRTRDFVEPLAVLASVAGAVPGILSLFSAQRTTTTGMASAPDSLAAAAAVMSALQAENPADSLELLLDDFRMVPDTGVHSASRRLADERDRLLGKKVASGLEQDGAERILALRQREQAALAKVTAPTDPVAHAREQERIQQEIDEKQEAIDRTAREIASIDALLTAIDSFTAAVGTIPPGATRSALTTAALHEQLRGSPPAFSHVLLIKAQPGRSQQLLDNRPLWLNDKFSTMVEVGVTYVLLSTATSGVLATGTATRIAQAYGTLGECPQLNYID